MAEQSPMINDEVKGLSHETLGAESPTVPADCSPVPLESILCTEELNRRPSRLPDYETENRALVALAKALADSPRTILQTLAETILDVFKADSAGLSLLTRNDGGKRFYWPAIAGVWKPHAGGGTPRDFGPCGDVLDRNSPLLFRHFERRYPYLSEVMPAAEECLLVPFYVHGKAVGTIWAIAHSQCRKFDAEDLRQLDSLGRFASAAYQAVEFTNELDFRRAALNVMEDAVSARHRLESLNEELRGEISERKHAEESIRRLLEEAQAREHELRAKQAQLVQVAKLASIGELASSVAHELNNPLNNVGLLVGNVLDQAQNHPIDPPSMRKHLTAALEQVNKAAAIIGHLRTFARTASTPPEPVDVHRVIRSAISLVEAQLRHHNVELVLDLSPNDPVVIGNAIKLEQVFINLLMNAHDAVERVVDKRIAITSTVRMSHVELSVRDTGVGISPEHHACIFDPFFTTKEVGKGTGLGLSISYGIIQEHGGTIVVESEPGKGATFIVTLPVPHIAKS